MYSWRDKSVYAEVRKRVAGISGIRSQGRIETGNINSVRYNVIWFIELEARVLALSNAFSPGQVMEGEICHEEWDKLRTGFSGLRSDRACKSAIGVSDGSAYFGEFSSGQEKRAFAVYGAVPFPRVPSAEGLYLQLSPCSEIVLKAYELARLIGSGVSPNCASRVAPLRIKDEILSLEF